jgi:L-aminopeptidase/D-esterase-like protein
MSARPGPQNALTDIAGLKIGCAADADLRTGVTLIVPDGRWVCGADVRGGGPGVREIEALNPEGVVDGVDAIALSGGSVYGLAAADELAALLGARGRGFQLIDRPGVPASPIVPAAILYDLANGAAKDWGDAPPYRALARAAFAGLSTRTPQGAAGAGFGARAGALAGGQGSASVLTHDGFTVGALACVNSVGSVQIPGTDAFWAWPFEIDGEFGGARPPADHAFDSDDWGAAKINPGLRQNTTLAVVAVDAALDKGEARRLAQMASAGMARAIRPVFAPTDGDVIFALASGAKPLAGPRAVALARLGNLAADCLTRAIARGVFEANRLA